MYEGRDRMIESHFLGRERPQVEISKDKLMFKFTGDTCNATHNYTMNFEMKCNGLLVAVALFDVINVRKLILCYICMREFCIYL